MTTQNTDMIEVYETMQATEVSESQMALLAQSMNDIAPGGQDMMLYQPEMLAPVALLVLAVCACVYLVKTFRRIAHIF